MSHYQTALEPLEGTPETPPRRPGPAPTTPPKGYTAAQAAHYAKLRMFKARAIMVREAGWSAEFKEWAAVMDEAGRIAEVEAKATMMPDTGLSAEVAAQAATVLDRARTATGDDLLAALEWPAQQLDVGLLAQVPPAGRAERGAEAVPWNFGDGEPRLVLHLKTLAAAGGIVGPSFRKGPDWLTKGAGPLALERAALALTEDVAQVHDLLDAWDAEHGGTLKRPKGIVWTALDYDAALDAVGNNWRDRAGLTVPRLLRALRARLPGHADAGGRPATLSHDEQLLALPERWRPPHAPAGLQILDPGAVAEVLAKARRLDYLTDDYRFKPRANDAENFPAVMVAILRRMCDRGALAHWRNRKQLVAWVCELFGVPSYGVESAGRAHKVTAYRDAYRDLVANGARPA